MELNLSTLPHTWLIDIDGTIFKHNSHLNDNQEKLLDGVKEFFANIPKHDFIILISAREEKYKLSTIKSLKYYDISFDDIIFGVPTGERIIINDEKPSGLKTAYAINIIRDIGLNDLVLKIDSTL